jgi:tryptophan 2,3-dioxygenase
MPLNYHDYLKLDQLLSAQKPISPDVGRKAHEELLFITVHHSYELWFKQILFELDSVLALFKAPSVSEDDMGTIVHRLERIGAILKNLITQVDILETMTPLDFLEFRDLLYPASGFQSLQFRLLENKLGLPSDIRLTYNSQPYTDQLKSEQVKTATAAESEATLFSGLQAWLERTPFLESEDFPFWQKYRTAVEDSFNKDLAEIDVNSFLTSEQKDRAREQMRATLSSFSAIFDQDFFQTERNKGHWRLSFAAIRAALLIQLYRDEPLFQQAFRLLNVAKELDGQLTQWRYRHALMAQKMLGRKVGTGGSSGSQYLKATAEKHSVFSDLFQLTSFFLPRSKLPALPPKAKRSMGFNYGDTQ